MTKLSWGETGTRLFEAGIDRGVFYPQLGPGIAWNGLISVDETPVVDESQLFYVDGKPYRRAQSGESFAATIQAVTYPDAFQEYDGYDDRLTQQRRKSFGLSYRTKIGNDVDGVDHGYKIHLVYNAMVKPSSRTFQSLNNSASLSSFSWDLSTKPVQLATGEWTAHLIIDSTKAHAWTIEALENALYGSTDSPSSLPAPADVLELFEENSIVRVTDHGDGTFTVSGPDDIVSMIDSTTFQVSWDSAVYIDTNTYTLSSL